MTLPNPFDFLGESQGNGAVATLEPPASTPEPTTAEPPKTTTAAATRTARASRKPLYIDIETIPDESRKHLFDLPPLPEIVQPAPETPDAEMMPADQWVTQDVAAARQSISGKNPSLDWITAARSAENLKDKGKPRKGMFELLDELVEMKNIAATSAAARAQAEIDQRKTMSVKPLFCRIVALGWAVGNDPAESLVVGLKTTDAKGNESVVTEKTILEKFWWLVGIHGPIVGYNVTNFDLPALFTRSILLGVDSSKKIDRKDWGNDVNDLMKKMFPFGQAEKLKRVATLLGIDIPADGVDGSQVAELFAKDPAKVAEYVRSDICVTRALHKKIDGTYC